jgi:hypothetical protein
VALAEFDEVVGVKVVRSSLMMRVPPGTSLCFRHVIAEVEMKMASSLGLSTPPRLSD